MHFSSFWIQLLIICHFLGLESPILFSGAVATLFFNGSSTPLVLNGGHIPFWSLMTSGLLYGGYLSLAAIHAPCYGVYYLIVRAKNTILPRSLKHFCHRKFLGRTCLLRIHGLTQEQFSISHFKNDV